MRDTAWRRTQQSTKRSQNPDLTKASSPIKNEPGQNPRPPRRNEDGSQTDWNSNPQLNPDEREHSQIEQIKKWNEVAKHRDDEDKYHQITRRRLDE